MSSRSRRAPWSTTSRTSMPGSGSAPAQASRCSPWSTASWKRNLGRSTDAPAPGGADPGQMTIQRAVPATDERLLTRPFVLLAIGELAYFIADGAALYLVPVHATGPLGSGQAGAGLAFGAF